MNGENEATPIGLGAAIEATAEPQDTAMQERRAKMFPMRNALDIINDPSEEPPELWGGLHLSAGEMMELIGPSGIGKSRILLNLAVNQILGRAFAGKDVCPKPLTWMFFGNENSFYRYRNDLTHMLKKESEEDRKKVGERIWIQSLEKAEDCDISVHDENVEKMKNTIRKYAADVVVFDPWGSVISGDELRDADVRESLAAISSMLRSCSYRNENGEDHQVVGIIVNHSRIGVREYAKAWGSEAENYGKNSKAILSVMRSVWNIRPMDPNVKTGEIEMFNAKRSNKQAYEPSCVKLNGDTLLYEAVTDHDYESVQRKYDKAARSGVFEKDVLTENREIEAKLFDYIKGVGSIIKTKCLESEWAKTQGYSKNKTKAALNRLQMEDKVMFLTGYGSPGANCKYVADTKTAEDTLGQHPNLYRKFGASRNKQDTTSTTPKNHSDKVV